MSNNFFSKEREVWTMERRKEDIKKPETMSNSFVYFTEALEHRGKNKTLIADTMPIRENFELLLKL